MGHDSEYLQVNSLWQFSLSMVLGRISEIYDYVNL
jgi:hypothetical protein